MFGHPSDAQLFRVEDSQNKNSIIAYKILFPVTLFAYGECKLNQKCLHYLI